MDFRKDINGLRAWAVLPIVLFHFNPEWLPGSFAGVDIFFVISGYLMTRIIFQGLESNRFSLFEFYINRVTRIFPVIAMLCLVLVIFGWFYLSATEYRSLGKHAASSVVFLSNVIYWTESGYFTPAAKENWLLHTWSLSVEWQFYLLYPFTLLVIKRFLILSHIKWLLLVSTVIGFMFCVLASNMWPSGAFYLLPARVWEFLMGGLVFLFPFHPRKKMSLIFEYMGLALICLFYFFGSVDASWPGFYAMIPVMGTCLILQAGRSDSIFTANIVFQKIGLWSYSIYIWHWPIVVYIYDMGYSLEGAIIGIALSVIAGFISYQLIEKKRSKEKPDKNLKDFLLFKPHLYILFLFSIATSLYLLDGVNNSYRKAAISEKSQYIDRYQIDNYFNKSIWDEYRLECDYYDLRKKTAKTTGISDNCLQAGHKGGLLLWGDSHAQALSYGLRKALPEHIPFHQVASSGCRPALGEDKFSTGEIRKACNLSNAKALESIINLEPDVIVLAQAKEHDLINFTELVDFLKENALSSKVVLIGPVPQWRPSLPKAIAKRHLQHSDGYIKDTTLQKSFLELDANLYEKYRDSELDYISLITSLCKGESCLAKVDNNNTPLHWDYGHLTPEGSHYVVSNIIYPRIRGYLKTDYSG